MPKIIKKKPVKRKPVEETEEVRSAALHALEAVKQRQKQAIIIVAVIVVAAVLLIGFNLYSSSRSQKASELEVEASRYYYREKPYDTMPDAERMKKALELYQGSFDAKSTPTALYYVGNSYFNLNDYENAIKQYTLFTEKFSSDYGILPLVYQKLASAYLKAGKSDKALETLGKLAGIRNGMFRDTALFMEARYYEGIGDTPKAQERYKVIAAEFPASPWAPEATAKTKEPVKQDDGTTPEQPPQAPEPSK